MCADVSGTGIGAVLMQLDDGQQPQFIAYASCVLFAAENKYSVTHLGAFAEVRVLKHKRHLLWLWNNCLYRSHSCN